MLVDEPLPLSEGVFEAGGVAEGESLALAVGDGVSVLVDVALPVPGVAAGVWLGVVVLDLGGPT